MSYRLDLSFKNCEKKDIYKNINELQQLLLKNAEEYIKQNLVYIRIDDTKDRWYNVDKIDNFIKTIFTTHIWYCDKIKALCVVWGSNVEEIDKWFDGYIYFQNSCDQNYDYKEWEFNLKFKSISDRVQHMNDKQFIKVFQKVNKYYDTEEITKDIDYCKQSFIYDKCYDLINPIWSEGFGVTFIDGALDENKFQLRNLTIKLLLEKDPELKKCLMF